MFKNKYCKWILGLWPVNHDWRVTKISTGKTWVEKRGSFIISYTRMYWHYKCSKCGLRMCLGGKKKRYY